MTLVRVIRSSRRLAFLKQGDDEGGGGSTPFLSEAAE
jgi:hypothetical protein